MADIAIQWILHEVLKGMSTEQQQVMPLKLQS